jgi:uncharacterized protein (TIGR00251 family)
MKLSEDDITRTKHGYLIEVKVIPNANKTELMKTQSGFRARIRCAPVDGKANEALIALLSDEFGIAKRNVEITRGKTSRTKTVLLRQE